MTTACQPQKMSVKEWCEKRVVQDQVDRYLIDGEDFINEDAINATLADSHNVNAEAAKIREIIAKSESLETLLPDELAALLYVKDPQLIKEMEEAALRIKLKVYDNRIVTFAPLYLSSKCVNGCTYCSFREGNGFRQLPRYRRKMLTRERQNLFFAFIANVFRVVQRYHAAWLVNAVWIHSGMILSTWAKLPASIKSASFKSFTGLPSVCTRPAKLNASTSALTDASCAAQRSTPALPASSSWPKMRTRFPAKIGRASA